MTSYRYGGEKSRVARPRSGMVSGHAKRAVEVGCMLQN